MATGLERRAGKAKERRPRNDRRRERNRERLVAATIALVLEEGSGALSMAGIAKRAGMHHRAFYAHFRNVEDCLEVAVADVWKSRHEQALALREALARSGPADFDAEVALTENGLRALLEYRPLYLLLLRCRYEQSRVGELAREDFERTAQEITEYVWRAALAAGARAEHLREFETLARYMLEGYAAVALDVLQDRTKELQPVAERLTRYHWALMAAELKRMLSSTPGPSRPSPASPRAKRTSRKSTASG